MVRTRFVTRGRKVTKDVRENQARFRAYFCRLYRQAMICDSSPVGKV
jgi:hypothetical protein